ncbi:MAG: hypothetical protein WBF89_10185 [Steroidobacteraceae bacterium]
MTNYDMLRDIHIGIGTVALTSFWVAAVLRKGTRLHRRLGDVYLLAMLGIVLTATPMAAVAYVRGKPVFGTFLAYLVLVTGTAAWLALRAIRRRGSIDSYLATPYRPLAWLNMGAGAVVFMLGATQGALLLVGMSVIGLLLGYRMLALDIQDGADRNWWLKRHYTGIIGSGAAAHIAFLNLGMRHLMPAGWFETLRYLWWFGPVLASAAVVIYLNRRFTGVARLGKQSDELPA